jgi:primosomal replication protein N
VTCEIPALALGDIALQASQMRQGQRVVVDGFIAQRSLHNKQLVLHINNIRSNEGA